MRFITIAMFAVAGRLVTLSAFAKPIPNWKAGGMAIPLARYSSSLTSSKSIDLDAISSHGISVRQKILGGLDNYEINTGTVHPLAMKRNESALETRGASVPLTTYLSNMWVGEILIGTPPQTLKVQIDTGSADMWVLETDCDGISGDRDLWDPHLSATSENGGRSFRLQYGDGTVIEGNEYSDNVTIAGFTADPQIFGSTLSYASPIQNNAYSDGLLGLAFPSVSKFGARPLFASLVSQNRLTDLKFSLKLTSSGAEMYVGGANSELYNGDIAYTRVTYPGYWQVYMDDIRDNGKKILENVPVIFDTGSDFIFGDWKRVSGLYRALGGTLKAHGGYGYYYLPCDSFPTLGFTFGGKTFDLPPSVLSLGPVEDGSPNCFGAIVGDRSSTDGTWTIGVTFLEGIYTVFDYGGLQVGFAELA